MVSALLSRLIILVFGTLYPAYASYKAVKTKDVREYVKWMMYWIVFAFFTAAETIADVFISWLPLYYEVKILFIVWMLLPATKGSSILFRRFVHPWLSKNEQVLVNANIQEIDRYIEHAKENGYVTLMRVGKQGLNMAADTFVRTAITGQNSLVQTLRRYKSLSDLNEGDTGSGDFPDGSGASQPVRATWYSGMPSDDQFNSAADYMTLQEPYDGRKGMHRNESIAEDPQESLTSHRTRTTSLPHNSSLDSGSGDSNFEYERSRSPEGFGSSESSPDLSKRISGIDNHDRSTQRTSNIRQSRTISSSRTEYGGYKANTLPRSRGARAPPTSEVPTVRTTRAKAARVTREMSE